MKYFFLISCILFLGACSSPSNEGESSISQPYVASIDQAAREITDTKEFSECLEPTVRMCITQVANELARKDNSLAFCENLSQGDDINSCKYGVVIASLAKNNDITQCDTLSKKYKIECRIASINLSAVSEGTIELCDQITEVVFGTQEAEKEKIRIDQCKFPIIMKKEDLKIADCDVLEEVTEKQTCISMVKNRAQQNSPTKK